MKQLYKDPSQPRKRTILESIALYIFFIFAYCLFFMLLSLILVFFVWAIAEFLFNSNADWLIDKIFIFFLLSYFVLEYKILYFKVFENKGFIEAIIETIAFYFQYLKIAFHLTFNISLQIQICLHL